MDSGVGLSAVASRFHIGKTTVYEWHQRRKETGDFVAKKPGSVGYGHKIIDWETFRSFAQQYGYQTQAEMAKLWEVAISRQTISRALQKIGFTRKKRLMGTKSVMKESVQFS